MIISCDLDEVCNNLCSVVIKLYNEDTGENLTLDDIKEYDISAAFKSEYQGRINQYFNHPQFMDMLEWNVKWLIPILRSVEDYLFFTTATYPKNIFKKYELLCQAIKSVDEYNWDMGELRSYIRSRLIMTANKHLIKKDVVIDDCIENLELNDSNVFNILVAKPWNIKQAYLYNAKFFDRRRIIIIKDVDDIPDIINAIRKYREKEGMKCVI